MAIYLSAFVFLHVVSSFGIYATNNLPNDNDLLATFSRRLELLEKRDGIQQAEIKQLRAELEDERKKSSELESMVQELVLGPSHVVKKSAFGGTPVEQTGDAAFFATLGNHLNHLGARQDIAFEHVITNRGNAYSPHTGAFTAPVTGTYVFSTTLRVQGFNNTNYNLVHNSNAVSRLYMGGVDAPFSSSSATVVLELTQGDVVAVQNVDVENYLNGNLHSMFAGFLLRIDENFGPTIVGK